ncbi:MAG: hypothetical protein KME29_11010 [Calothrix sp. FI2-JRJ7]|jgi:hypothetical protein|nr:hypothetical protein [Calothrix sp. FI2-JRJ7]
MMSQKRYIDYKNKDINSCPKVPESIMTASRCELTDIQMKICGNLPSDLYGHVFMVTPTLSLAFGEVLPLSLAWQHF